MNAEPTALRAGGRSAGLEVRLLAGVDVLDRLGRPLDELLDATCAPVTARRPWLSVWVRCHPEYAPLAVAVEDGGGRLEAVALLGRRRRFGIDDFVALGHGPSDMARLPARTREAAAALASATAEHLKSHGGLWQLTVRHLPRGDAVAEQLATSLRGAVLAAGDVAPALRIGPVRLLRHYVSTNHHRDVRRLANRARREGIPFVIEHTKDSEGIRAVLPLVEEVSRRRDVTRRGASGLERESVRSFFRQVVLEHAARGEVELTTVRAGQALAGYTLCFLDRGARRVWNCKVSPDFTRYGVGRMANDAALRHAIEDPDCSEFDWMRGEEAYKSGLSNHVERMQDLLAWSSPSIKAALHLRRYLKDGIKSLASRHGALQSALRLARSTQFAVRRACRALLGVERRRNR